MPSGYNEIPGVYTESPRPLAGFRRTMRNYRWCLGATVCILLVIAIAAFVSVLIGTSIDNINSERNEALQATGEDPKNKTVKTLLSLSWPRRDEEWYKNRWRKTHMRCPFGSETSSGQWCYEEGRERLKRKVKRDADDEEDLPDWEGLHGTTSEVSREPYETDEDLNSENYEFEESRDYEDEDDGSTFPSNDTFNWNRKALHVPEFSAMKIGEVMSRSSQEEKQRQDLEDHLFDNDVFLKARSPAFYHQKAFRKTSSKAIEMAKQGYRMDGASRDISNILKLSKELSTFDLRWLGDLNESPYCDYGNLKIQCSRWETYRSLDGTCNNLKSPHWGVAFTPFRRAMPPDYSDGVLLPRKAKNGQDLPGARDVSLKVHLNKRVASESYTHLTMTWGQFIDHDITATAQAKGKNGTSLACCQEDGSSDETLRHPECFSISIPEDDDFYRSLNRTCMEFSRSASSPRCMFGPREQMNQNSHFLDGSVIYGSSTEEMNELRTHKEGLLRTQITIDGRQLLTPSLNPNDSCNTEQQMKWKQHCFVSGDSRVNEHTLLTIMHTVWTRQHNYIAVELRDINPDWNDEKLFQETRRIIIAQIQHITYHEYLPSILGPHISYGLKLSPSFSEKKWTRYNPKVHPGIANGFAGAAFRFGHSMIQGLMQSVDASGANVKFEQIRKYFFNPFAIYDPKTIPDMIRGTVSQRASAVDTYFTSQVTNRLFQTPETNYGLDLVAINIQRGRDHGIPSYTRWRMMCGLPHANNFTDLEADMDGGALESIKGAYKDVDDIDFYTGGLAEIPVKDGLVGPTFACVIADQFLRLKIGDRFWYEYSDGPNAFTKDQLFELRKTTLARILCNNIGELGSIQRWALRKFETDNPRLPCSARSIPRMSLGPWEEGNI